MRVIERVSDVSTVRADALERAQRALTRGWVDILVFTSADLVVEWVSPSVHDVGGWHPDELIGRTALSLIHPDDVATVVETMGGVIDAGLVYDPLGETPLDPARFTATSLRFACKDGTWVTLESRGNTMLGVDGVDGLLFVLRDITDRTTIDELLHAIASGAPVTTLVHQIEQAVRAHLRGAATTVVLPGHEAFMPASVGMDPRDLAAAMTIVATSGEGLYLDLPTGLRRGLWLLPVVDASGCVLATIVVWNIEPGRPTAWTRQVIDRIVQLATIALVRHHETERVRQAATCDPLTGLANRRDLDHRLDQLAREPHRPPCTMLYLDLDRFKPINDRFGHAVGDAVLAVVAERLRATARSTDVIARLGGDEFVVVCCGVATDDEAAIVADRIRRELEQPINVDGAVVSIGASIGWVVIQGTDAMHDILSRADAEMYRVKLLRRTA